MPNEPQLVPSGPLPVRMDRPPALVAQQENRSHLDTPRRRVGSLTTILNLVITTAAIFGAAAILLGAAWAISYAIPPLRRWWR